MVCFQFTDRLSMGEEEMKLDFSSLSLLADVASLISEGKLGLASAIFDRDDEKKDTIVTTTFWPTWVRWVVRKKRCPRARGLTFHAQKLSSDPVGVGVVVHKNKNKQENLRGVSENRKKRSRAFDSTETQKSDRVSKKPKKTEQKNLANPIGPSELPTIFMYQVLEMRGRDLRFVVEKELSATDMNRSQSRLSIPKSLVLQGFLSDQEIRTLDSKQGIKVSLIDPCLEVHHGLRLKKWSYGSKTFSYVLTGRWNAVAHPYKPNELEKDGIVQIWSFRVDGNLRFCLAKVEAPVLGNENSGSA